MVANKWKKGNGTVLLGSAIMIISLSIALMFVQIFIINEQKSNQQLATDTLSDSTATYLLNEGGDYSKAVAKANETKTLIKDVTGTDVGTVSIDKDKLEKENTVQVTAVSQNKLFESNADSKNNTYTLETTSGTKYATIYGSDIPCGPGVDGAVQWMESIAADDTHGYSQANRGGNPDYDCSSFVFSAFSKAGILPPPSSGFGIFTTAIMPVVLPLHNFVEVPVNFSTGEGLIRGDILWRNGHTEVYAGNGKRVGAHKDYDGKSGDSTGKEISVVNYSNNSWTKAYRYIGN